MKATSNQNAAGTTGSEVRVPESQKQCGHNPLLAPSFVVLEDQREFWNKPKWKFWEGLGPESRADQQANADGMFCGKCATTSCESCCNGMGYDR